MGLRRLFKIATTISAYHLDKPLARITRWNPFALTRTIAPWLYLHPSRKLPYELRVKKGLESLGPLFVKFGQILSTRRDLLPPEIANALSGLQDNVPPFDSDIAIQAIEKSLGQPIGTLFRFFDPKPVAAASIAQVHAAILPTGEKVAVKVLRPNVRRQVAKDVQTLYRLARWIERFSKASRRFHPTELVTELERTLDQELDLRQEAANASLLARNFENSELIHVPKVYFDLTSADVMVSEYINGINISDRPALEAAGVDFALLAERGVEIFFTQAFEHCFFHADMHPGNIFINPERPDNPQYIAVDFGIMGTLSPVDQHYLAENFLAFFNRDYRRVAVLHVESGWAPKDTNIEAFSATIRTLCEPIFGKPISEISFAQSLMQLLQASRAFQIEAQPQLLLLQKTLFNIEGLGRELYPDLDLWATAKPFMEKWMRKRRSPKAVLGLLARELPGWVHQQLNPVKPTEPKHLASENQRGCSSLVAFVSGILFTIAGYLALMPSSESLPALYLALGLALCAALLLWTGFKKPACGA
ncbi:MAG: 2-polyprenylphenol 6-hydroxylase [Legionellales bacterium]|nr:2-polyprenylphenol 6-hydroxylase [Legionellales bacterium]|tara:strand:+ start:44 stop:1642 length:1599 start_codon:yes stop_codon:yes gene_type:complete